MPAKPVAPSPSGDLQPIGLARPAQRALAGAGITSLRQLVCVTEAELLTLHGMGPNGVARIRAAMRGAGIDFAAPKKGAVK